jgi:hypothetical protein
MPQISTGTRRTALTVSVPVYAGVSLAVNIAQRLFNHKTRNKWFHDLGIGHALLVRGVQSDKLVFAFEAPPKLLILVRIKTFLPLKIDQA